MSTSTSRTYRVGQTAFAKFCRRYHRTALPASTATLCLFVANLQKNAVLRAATIRVYLAGVRHLHLLGGETVDAFRSESLAAVLVGTHRLSTRASSPPARKPITSSDLAHIKTRLFSYQSLPSIDRLMLWSAVTLGYYGFLRGSEYTSRSSHSSDPDRTILRRHVTLEFDHLEVYLPMSKTDQCGEGTTLTVGTSGTAICAVAAMEAYTQALPGRPSDPLFRFVTGANLTLRDLNAWLKRLSDGKFTSHSLRIGAATAAAKAGLPDWTIRRCGRWKSDAYLTYIRTSGRSTKQVARQISAV